LDEAEKLFQRVTEIYSKAYGDRHYRVALAISNSASVYLNRKDYARAEAMYREAIERYRQVLPPGHAYIAIAEIKLGRALVAEKRYAEAEQHTLAGYRELSKQVNASVTWLQSARKDLVAIYDALGQPAKAAGYR
jgi:serine/threonine-protein kinase